MISYLRFLAAFCLSLFYNTLIAQQDSTHIHPVDTADLKYVSFDFIHLSDSTDFHPLDYNLPFFFYRYSSVNPLSIFNGNAGSFAKSFEQSYIISDDYFNPLPFHQHLLTDMERVFPVIAQNPSSNVFYSSGQKKEQHFYLFHSQRIRPELSFTLNYNLISAPGLYTSQRTNQSHFYGYLIYKHKNNRYAVTGGVTQNKIQQKENGGIAMAEQFEDSTLYDRQFALVNFLTAERTYRDVKVYVKEFYKITKSEAQLPFVIGHTSSLKTMKNVFSDTDPLNSPYPNVWLDSLETYDSTYVFQLTNELSLSNFSPLDSIKPDFQWWLGYQLQHSNFKQRGDKETFTRSMVRGGIQMMLSSSVNFNVRLNYYNGKYNHSNYHAIAELSRKFNSKFIRTTGVQLSSSAMDPLFLYQRNTSNHYIWSNQFLPQKQQSIAVILKTLVAELNLSYKLLSDHVYLNEFAFPEQDSNSTGMFHAHLKSVLTPGRFYIESQFGINALPEDATVRLPAFYALMKAGIEFPMFKNTLKAFVGIEGLYFTKFYSDTWSPSTGLFHLQDRKEIGNYVYPGVFVGIHLKRARIFVMMENVTAGLFDMDYYAMPAYPRYDRFFRWGLSWSFFN